MRAISGPPCSASRVIRISVPCICSARWSSSPGSSCWAERGVCFMRRRRGGSWRPRAPTATVILLSMAEDNHQHIIDEVIELARKQLKQNGMLDFTALTIDEQGLTARMDID